MRNKAFFVCFIASAVVALSACGSHEPEHTVSWYRAHQKAKTAMVAKCRDNPGALAATVNCKNAERAAFVDDAHAGAAPLKPIK